MHRLGCLRSALAPSKASISGGALRPKPDPCLHLLTSVRQFYFPRKSWFGWKQHLTRRRKAAVQLNKHIWPRKYDPAEAPIFTNKEDGTQISFRDKDIRLGVKRMLEFAKLIRGKQIHDAIDWVEAMSRMQSVQILKLLRRALKECKEKHGMDLSRVQVFDAQPQRGYSIKSLRLHSRGKYGFAHAPRNLFMIRVRELTLEETFHKYYIKGDVPQSLSADMRLAVHEGRVGKQMLKEWAPYICANSRFFHRRALKWLDCTRQFDYYQARREWIRAYEANRLRQSTEARLARGLAPLAIE